MKRLVFLVLFCSILSFSNSEYRWYSTDDIKKIKKDLQIGDIIIYKPLKGSLTTTWGHNMLVINDEKFVDFPSRHTGYREIPIDFAEDDKREFLVVRYKAINKEIQNKIIKEIDKYIYYKYFIFSFPDIDTGTTYCSLFVYNIFKKAVGDVLEYDHNIVRPFNFLWSSKYFKVVDFPYIKYTKE